MKVGYPDTINNKAYQGEKSPFKMVDKSKADLDKDGKVSDYEENRAEAAFGDAPLNYSPVKNKEKASSEAKKSARKVAKGFKKYAKAHEASSQGFQETRKSKRLNKAGDRKTEKGRKIANKLSPEQLDKAVEIFTKREDKQDKKRERKAEKKKK